MKNREIRRSNRRRIILLSTAALLVAGVCGGAVYGYWTIFGHRFWTVTEGEVYRSAEMPSEKLARKVQEHGIRAVIDLRRDDDNVAVERSVLTRLGVKHIHLPSRQIPSDETVKAFLEVMGHQEHRPVLIHCEHGEGRAPLFSAIYRIEYEGWSNDRARRASKFLPFIGNFAPDSRKGKFLRNYVPRRQLDDPTPRQHSLILPPRQFWPACHFLAEKEICGRLRCWTRPA